MQLPINTQIVRNPNVPLTPIQAARLDAIEKQKRITAYPYYSTVTFEFTKSGDAGGPYAWILNRGTEVRAFSYGKGDLMTNAGAPAVAATAADTNLVQASETISGENVKIHGLSCMVKQSGLNLQQLCDPAALAALQTNCSVDLSLNGDQNRFNLGCLAQIPGAGGLQGGAGFFSGPSNADGRTDSIHFLNNGWATRSNFFRMPEGLTWRNKGQADSQLQVIFRIERDIYLYSGGTLENNANGIDITGQVLPAQNYAYPGNLEVTLLVHLMGSVEGPRTRSA